MPQQYSGRVTLILAVLLAFAWMIFPSPSRLLDPAVPWGQKHDLRPGIDMVGGTSLLYEIKPPPGGMPSSTLAEEVMQSLKKRVDPEGTRNLIWRPQGATRLEIQMPLTNKSDQAAERRDAFAKAQQQLEQLNVRPAEVLRAVEKLSGEERAKRLSELAGGDPRREELFNKLATTYDAIQAAKQQQNAPEQATQELAYEDLKRRIDETNITAAELSAILTMGGEARDKRLAELRQNATPQQLDAISTFETAFRDYNEVKGSLEDAADLKRLLRGSGVLEFYILAQNPNEPGVQEMIQRLEKTGPRVQANDTMRWFEVERPEELGGGIQRVYGDKHYVLSYVTPDKSMTKGQGGTAWALEQASRSQTEFGASAVGFRFDAAGGEQFGNLTGKNIGELMAVVLDDKVISAATIQSRISRQGVITRRDGYTEGELRYLINTLNAGSLPAQLAEEPISERTVGPQLGKDNLRAGFIACIFGLVIVAIFLTGYYYLAGVVATFAVLMNMVIILGAMAALNATFTLPGIAGIVLTIGMAVDANVLIFERLREEQQRGLSLRMALRNAYDRAWSAILDSNVTTGITSLILYWFGSEEVKGFGLTLLIGVVASMFTALFVTKTVFGILIDKFNLQKLGSLPLTFPKWDQLLRPNIDWMGKAWIFYTFSAVVIVAGLTAFGVKLSNGEMFDIEFTSGTSVQFELDEPMSIGEVRQVVHQADQANPGSLPSPAVVEVTGTEQRERVYEVITPQKDARQVRQALLTAFAGKLKVDVPSTFDHAGESLEQAGDVVIPIDADTTEVAGLKPQSLSRHIGGAAIVLRNLQPPISPTEIEQRIEQQRLQPQPGQAAPAYRDFHVEAESGPDNATSTAVILVSDPAFPHEQDEGKWREELVRPMWQLTNDAVTRPAELQRVTNFDAQVAGETQRDALVAMVLSIIVIMAYIWIRFGNLKYGTATVFALLHDTLFTLAAIGLSHYLASTALGDALMVEPFRINLTMVAALLTVMGYSMNDTVVVFDRIRENRGKFGLVNRQIINDSINQTLSRTLLTGGTTIVTIFVMYVFGGPGIHGFTFALLVGILVGTYSSIAIAAPILLIGGEEQPEGTTGKSPVGGRLQKVGG